MKIRRRLAGFGLVLVGLTLAPAFGANSWADLYSGYVGNRTNASSVVIDTAGGMTASGNSWAATGNNKANKGVRLDWTVDSFNGNWVYTYTFGMASGALKDILNFDLQMASDFVASDLVSASVSTPATGVSGPTAGVALPAAISENYGAISPTPSQLIIAKGYQWSFAGTADNTFTLTITSTRAPVWGDFIVSSSEQTATEYLTAYNSAFGTTKGAFPTTGGVYDGQGVAVPGGPPPAPSNYMLTVTFAGDGSGTVNNNFQGAPCSGPSCTASLPTGQIVTLYATPDSTTSKFTGWSGDCGIGVSGNCIVAMDAAKEAIATFSAYQNLQDAFDKAPDTIRSLGITYTEDLLFNRPGVALKLIGGFDSGYTSDSGVTTIKGSLKIQDGTLSVRNVRIQ